MKTKKTLIICGHPDAESYVYALADAYQKGAESTGAEVRRINIRDLKFNPNLQYGYRQRTELEPDLLEAQALITWAEHIVWVYPVWWSGYPAIMKGFIDRIFLPGYAYQKRENSLFADSLLKGRTARIIYTLDQPNWWYHIVFRAPSTNAMKKGIMGYVGIKPTRSTAIGPIRLSKDSFRQKWLDKVMKLGENLK